MKDDLAKALASRNRQKARALVTDDRRNASRREKFMAVYLSRAESTGLVKIGTTINVPKRIRDLQFENGPMTVLRTVRGGYLTESWFHQRFGEYRVTREWFAYCEEMLTAEAPDMAAETSSGDLGEFARAALSFQPNLLRYARRLLSDDPEELVQRTIVRALERRRHFQPGTDLRAWLFTIMHNEAINIYRAVLRRPTCALMDRVAVAPTQEKHVLASELASIAFASKTWSDAFRLNIAGLDDDEASRALGIPLGTFKSRIHRARAAMREACL